jgi:hypothetical protein
VDEAKILEVMQSFVDASSRRFEEYRLFKRVVRRYVSEDVYAKICHDYNIELQKLRKEAK